LDALALAFRDGEWIGGIVEEDRKHPRHRLVDVFGAPLKGLRVVLDSLDVELKCTDDAWSATPIIASNQSHLALSGA